MPVDDRENIVSLSRGDLFRCPFTYLSGHKLVEFTSQERKNFETYVNNGGFVFVDDCNHDIDGLFAKSFEAELAKMFDHSLLQPHLTDADLEKLRADVARLAPGVPHSVINYASGVLHLRLTPLLSSAAVGFGLKSFLYSSVIHGALAADRPADLLAPGVVWTLVGGIVVLLIARAIVRRRR